MGNVSRKSGLKYLRSETFHSACSNITLGYTRTCSTPPLRHELRAFSSPTLPSKSSSLPPTHKNTHVSPPQNRLVHAPCSKRLFHASLSSSPYLISSHRRLRRLETGCYPLPPPLGCSVGLDQQGNSFVFVLSEKKGRWDERREGRERERIYIYIESWRYSLSC